MGWAAAEAREARHARPQRVLPGDEAALRGANLGATRAGQVRDAATSALNAPDRKSATAGSSTPPQSSEPFGPPWLSNRSLNLGWRGYRVDAEIPGAAHQGVAGSV